MKYRLTVKGQVALVTVILVAIFAVGYSGQFSKPATPQNQASPSLNDQTKPAKPETAASVNAESESTEGEGVKASSEGALSQEELKQITAAVYFDPDQWAIKAGEIQKLSVIVEQLAKYPTHKIVIEGNIHGFPGAKDSEFGTDLSLKRAQVVAQVLMGKGIDESRIIVKSNGSSAPISSDEDKIWMNRRASIYIEGFKGVAP